MNQENREKRKQALEQQQNSKEINKPTVNGGGVTGKLKRKRTETAESSVNGRTVKATNGKNASDSEDEFY